MSNSDPRLAKTQVSIARRIAARLRRRIVHDVVNPSVLVIGQSDLFDAEWYIRQYPDVAAAGLNPVEHYVFHGAAEGRNPSAEFDTSFYLSNNPDVARAGMNPLQHYIENGAKEGRICMERNADTATILKKAVGVPAKVGPVVATRAKPVTRVGPLVSIVIPAYAVERYIGDCLGSIIKQTYRDFEVIVVDDGSPDGTYDAACAIANKDGRIRVLKQDNSGPGAARNKAIAVASGQYLTFVDADDILPPTALFKMVSTLERTGSDFVVGALTRLRHGKVMPPDDWVKEVHAEDREGIRLVDFPDILKNVFVWNKMFKSEFFRGKVGSFPEGVLYEDQEPTALAYLHGVFDVLSEVIYHWRVREDGSSITQNKTDINDLRDRLVAKQRVSHILASAEPEVYGTWLAKAMGFDLRPYFEQVPRTDIDFFDQLRECMAELANQMTPRLWRNVRMIDRLPALAVLAGQRDDVGVAIARREEYGYFVPGCLRDGLAYLDRKYLEGMQLSLDDELLVLGPADLLHVSKMTSLRWHGDRLRVEGYAYLADLPFSDDFRITAELSADGHEPVELEVNLRDQPRVDLEGRDAWNSHGKSGFVVDICPAALRLDAEASWRMYITISSAGLNDSYRAVMRDVDARGIPDIRPVSAVVDGLRWMVGFEAGLGLVLRAQPDVLARVTAVRTGNETVSITTEGQTGKLKLRRDTDGSEIEVTGCKTGKGKVTFCCRLPEVAAGDAREHIWRMHLDTDEGRQELAFVADADTLLEGSSEHQRVRATMGPRGELKLMQTCWRAIADNVIVTAAEIIFRGRIELPEGALLRARLVSSKQELAAEYLDFDPVSQQFEVKAVFDPAIQPKDETCDPEQDIPVQPGDGIEHPVADFRPTIPEGFSLRISVTWRGKTSEQWVKVGSGLRRQMPVERTATRYGVTCVATPKSALWVNFRAPYKDEERGRYWQRELHAAVWASRGTADPAPADLEDAVVFESFGGKQISDSVLAICNEVIRRDLGLKLYWTVADMGMPIPDGTTPLLVHSKEWMERLRDSRYLVNNNNFPACFRKSVGQIYLQTWHGTPLKRIGNDIPRTGLSLLYRQLMNREAQYWDYLLAQNDFAADALPRAFGYEGRTLNLGYPRNDALAGDQAAARRRMARRAFGFEPYHFVVLYAPTWRDNLSGAQGYSRVEYLDFKRVRKALGDNARILARGHHNTSKSGATHHDGVMDVTHHPDINDLLLAADLLITDYSSVMFDYAITGKPVVYLAPDLEEYRDKTRGFYLDFEAIAPGPICCNNDEIVDVLSHLGTATDTYVERYRAFVKEFAPRDDGMAAARVVDAVWD